MHYITILNNDYNYVIMPNYLLIATLPKDREKGKFVCLYTTQCYLELNYFVHFRLLKFIFRTVFLLVYILSKKSLELFKET
jgi:hypothetical protein